VQHGAFGEPEFAQKVGDLSEGTFVAGLGWNPVKPRVIELTKRYEAKYDEPYNYVATYGYQATYVLADAIERAKSIDRKAIRDALAQTQMEDHIMPFLGPITFDQRGECASAQILLQQIQDRKQCAIWPQKFAKCKAILPMPGWVKK
jgi:branched-chain amino acid transport system substrate-binding protein